MKKQAHDKTPTRPARSLSLPTLGTITGGLNPQPLPPGRSLEADLI
jgi:hypothetical protein